MHSYISLYDCVSSRHWIKRIYSSCVPKSIKKTKEESTPLPDPFALPTNFCPDVHLCLAKKKMTKASRAVFYTAVAAAMFQYKQYPSRDDFISIARQIIVKYPFSWVKEFRSKSCKKFTCLFHACTAFPDGGFPFFPSVNRTNMIESWSLARMKMGIKGSKFKWKT